MQRDERLCQKVKAMRANTDLVIHPATRCDAIRRLTAAIGRSSADGQLRFSYRIEGSIAGLRLPDAGTPERADSLWQHSCFEAFLQTDGTDSYHEFNFAPSGGWAVYRFHARRDGRESPALPAPRIRMRRSAESFDMNVSVAVSGLPEFRRPVALRAGLAAVIEDARGLLSYWALAHHSPQPDFHDPAAFSIAVAAR